MYTNYNGINYFVERLENENDKSYNLRKWIISKNEPKTEKEFKNICKLAKLYVNMVLLGCKYSVSIEESIKNKIPKNFF